MQNYFDLKTAILDIEQKIIKIKYKKSAVVAVEDAMEIVKIIAEQFPDEQITFGILNNISEMKELTREARDYFAINTRPNTLNAIVINKYLQSILTKMYFSFSKPKGKTEVFENEEEAIKWIENNLKTQ